MEAGMEPKRMVNTQIWGRYPKYSGKQTTLTCVTQNDSATSSYCRLSQRLHGVRCLMGDWESICRWFSRSKVFSQDPWAGQQHLQAPPGAQAPEHGSGEDIWMAGWLVTSMSWPHVICSITIYDPLILNHKKRHLWPRPGDTLLCLLWTQPLQSFRSTPGAGKTGSLILSAKTSVLSWAGFRQLLWGTGVRWYPDCSGTRGNVATPRQTYALLRLQLRLQPHRLPVDGCD